jgi:hypothetical protein
MIKNPIEGFDMSSSCLAIRGVIYPTKFLASRHGRLSWDIWNPEWGKDKLKVSRLCGARRLSLMTNVECTGERNHDRKSTSQGASKFMFGSYPLFDGGPTLMLDSKSSET